MYDTTKHTFANFLRVVSVHLLSVVPPVLGPLEEVRLPVLVCEGSVDVPGQGGPRAGDQLRVSRGDAVFRQPPVVLAW